MVVITLNFIYTCYTVYSDLKNNLARMDQKLNNVIMQSTTQGDFNNDDVDSFLEKLPLSSVLEVNSFNF